jgi:uncharacterized protein (DUF488 family)
MMKVFTVGYGGRSKEEFLSLIKSNGINTVVDIRLRPDRARIGFWSKAKTSDKGIEGWLSQAGIRYKSFIELGNIFLDYHDWHERYEKLMNSCGGLLTQQLVNIPGPICLLCAERIVEECHRKLVADFLASHYGAEVHHLA